MNAVDNAHEANEREDDSDEGRVVKWLFSHLGMIISFIGTICVMAGTIAVGQYQINELRSGQIETRKMISDMPPPEWKRRVEVLESHYDKIQSDQTEIKLDVRAVKTILEQIAKNMQ